MGKKKIEEKDEKMNIKERKKIIHTWRCRATDSRRIPKRKPLYWKWMSTLCYLRIKHMDSKWEEIRYWVITYLWVRQYVSFIRIRSTTRSPQFHNSSVARMKDGLASISFPLSSRTHLQHLKTVQTPNINDSTKCTSSEWCQRYF